MTSSGTQCVALVAGGSGIVGHSVAMELKRQGWKVRALARRPITGIETIAVDLTNRDAIAAALRPANDTTHLFYAALSPDPNLSVEAERNGLMLGNLLDGLSTVEAPLRRVVSYEGFKIYGIHLGASGRRPEKAIRRTCRPTSTSHSGHNSGRAHRVPAGTVLPSFQTSWWEISLAIR